MDISGFYGINLPAQNYTTTLFARSLTVSEVSGGKVNFGFSDSSGQTIYGQTTVDVSKAPVNTWFYLIFVITVSNAAPTIKNFFFIEFPEGARGDFEFNLISCFPSTFNNRPNGARADIAQA
ncbi:unnamed protein product [Adineta ricciae]|uniref:Uncharacterized protein n=1 Tax=Adineta ricciae TaxID=249248 RepID=A0A815YZJ2_ADIRI|nr:unnamed protein product [Adineta ricciae]